MSVKELKYYHNRMTTAISELEMLGDDHEYTEIVSTYADIVKKLENRREIIQRRKYAE